MAKYLSFYRNAIRVALNDRDESDYTWANEELDAHIEHAVRDLSNLSPTKKMAALGFATQAGSTIVRKELDISSLTDLVFIDDVVYKPEQTETKHRNWRESGDGKITVDITANPIATLAGTLTGTVTFTRGSTAVTGSSTLFDTELEAGDYIKMSTGDQYYKIESVTDATKLVLSWPSVDNGADTVSITQWADYNGTTTGYPAYVYYTAMHDIDSDSSTIPDRMAQIIIDGGVAYTLQAWCTGSVDRVEASIALFTKIGTALDAMNTACDLAVTDTKIVKDDWTATNKTAIGTEIDLLKTEANKIDGYITNATAYINTLATGKDVIGDYNKLAQGSLTYLQAELMTVQGLLAEQGQGEEYRRLVESNLSTAQGFAREAQVRMQEVNSQLSVTSILNMIQRNADAKFAIYQMSLHSGSTRTFRTRYTHED